MCVCLPAPPTHHNSGSHTLTITIHHKVSEHREQCNWWDMSHGTWRARHNVAMLPWCSLCGHRVQTFLPGTEWWAHLSPGVLLISDLAHDSGILQSDLFTSRSQNLVLAKLPNSGFWRYGQFFKWNRVKMAKNGLKMVEIFLEGLTYDK